LASGRRVPNEPKKVAYIWIPYAKVTQGQFIFGRCSKNVSPTYTHIDFGDLHRVMMTVLTLKGPWALPIPHNMK